MIRKLKFLILFLICSTFAVQAAGDWKLHPTFDKEIATVVDTPGKVWMLAYGQVINPEWKEYSEPYPFLFAYDKEADEMISYSKRNYLSSNLPVKIAYNPYRDYLLVVYSDSNIDLIYDNGKIINIQGLKSASLTSSKGVNGISFDKDKNRAYLATDFGYLVLDDSNGEIQESLIAGKPFLSMARVGDRLLLADSNSIRQSSVDSRHLSLDVFEHAASTGAVSLLPLDGNKFAVADKDGNIRLASLDADGKASVENHAVASCVSVSPSKQGYYVASQGVAAQLGNDGSLESVILGDEDHGLNHGSWDFKEFWCGVPRVGLRSKKYDGKAWSVTRQSVSPNAPAVFISEEMAYSDKYGLLVSNHGIDTYFGSYQAMTPILLSGLKNGEWVMHGLPYTDPDRASVLTDPNGLAIDPSNPDHVYFGSFLNGIVRLDLADPQNLLHLSHPADVDAGSPGFHAIVDSSTWTGSCPFSAPRFDGDGNLWAGYYTGFMAEETKYPNLFVWPKEALRSGNTDGWVKLHIPDMIQNKAQRIMPLRYGNNRNIVAVVPSSYDGPLIFIDHKGTLADSSDDVVVRMAGISDQDGSSVTKNYIYCMYEDPQTGLLWVGTKNGVFTVNPRNAFSNPSRVNRIKVSRNDGTNLADYLLDGVAVNAIAVDGRGYKWFGTEGGGLVCTSSDGKTVHETLTTDNSYIPDNSVFGLAYNKDNNSMVVSTQSGIGEYFISGSASAADGLDAVRVYPNPVRPDYYGWVTIDGLVDNSMVKIVDASGNLVKELGLSSGSEARWDVTNLDYKRARTGVYYVMASNGPGDQNLAKVAKILVVN